MAASIFRSSSRAGMISETLGQGSGTGRRAATEVSERPSASTSDGVTPIKPNAAKSHLQDYRDFGPTHGSGKGGACNILFADGSIKSFNDANGNFDAAGDRTVFNAAGDRGRGTDVNWLTRDGNIVERETVDPSEVVGYVAIDPNAAFVFADTGARANAGRNVLRAPGLNNWDLAVFKRFPITENHRLEFRAEMFNAFNHPQFVIDDPFALDYVNVRSADFQNKRLFSGNPYGTIPTFGLITNPLASGNPRVIQMVLRYSF